MPSARTVKNVLSVVVLVGVFITIVTTVSAVAGQRRRALQDANAAALVQTLGARGHWVECRRAIAEGLLETPPRCLVEDARGAVSTWECTSKGCAPVVNERE